MTRAEKEKMDMANVVAFCWLTNMATGLGLIKKELLPKAGVSVDEMTGAWLELVKKNMPENEDEIGKLLSSERGREMQLAFGCLLSGLAAFDCLLQEQGYTAWDIIQGIKKSYDKLVEQSREKP